MSNEPSTGGLEFYGLRIRHDDPGFIEVSRGAATPCDEALEQAAKFLDEFRAALGPFPSGRGWWARLFSFAYGYDRGYWVALMDAASNIRRFKKRGPES